MEAAGYHLADLNTTAGEHKGDMLLLLDDQLPSPTKFDSFCYNHHHSDDTTNLSMTEDSAISAAACRPIKRQRSTGELSSSSNDVAESHFRRLTSVNSADTTLHVFNKQSSMFNHPIYHGTQNHANLPPIGPDGVAVGVPCMPTATAAPPPVYGWLMPPPMSIFAKSSVLAPPTSPQQLSAASASAILRDVLDGKLNTLPIGLKLDAAAVAKDMQNTVNRR